MLQNLKYEERVILATKWVKTFYKGEPVSTESNVPNTIKCLKTELKSSE